MVAISLYRGNLHRVPDVPRQWLMPNHPISVKHFKSLLSRRSKSLSHHRSTTSSNPNPNSNQKEQGSNQNECKDDDVNAQPLLELAKASDVEEGTSKEDEDVIKEVKEELFERLDVDGGRFEKSRDVSVSVPALELVVANNASDPVDGKGSSEAVPKEEMTSDKMDALNEKEKRKREIEDKLQILNARKHNLVQGLKQILNVEEELKRRNSMQALATRPSVPLQVDVTNDSALMTRHGTPRMGSEANLGGDVEGAEADDVSNHNMHSRRFFRMSSTSPTSESPLRRPGYLQHSAVPHPSRTILGASGSPSRFAPMGHQGHPANFPSVSVSGTNYFASSPSPAASGGTSVFRDARHPSPWN